MKRKRPFILAGVAVACAWWLATSQPRLFGYVTFGTPQWRLALPSDSVPRSVAEAQAAGVRHPQSPAAASFIPFVVADATVGTAERRCIDVGSANVARSGEFYVSPLATYAKYWREGIHPPGKVSWFGAHARAYVPLQLVLRVARIDSAGPAYVFIGRTRILRRAYARSREHGAADAADFDLPTPGTWLLVATIDQDWGCFVYSLKAAP